MNCSIKRFHWRFHQNYKKSLRLTKYSIQVQIDFQKYETYNDHLTTYLTWTKMPPVECGIINTNTSYYSRMSFFSLLQSVRFLLILADVCVYFICYLFSVSIHLLASNMNSSSLVPIQPTFLQQNRLKLPPRNGQTIMCLALRLCNKQ